MKTIGIVAHSFEGAALCFVTACREGAVHLGPHMHPNIVMSAVPMALSLPGWDANDYSAVGKFLTQGVQMVADAGADFLVVGVHALAGSVGPRKWRMPLGLRDSVKLHE